MMVGYRLSGGFVLVRGFAEIASQVFMAIFDDADGRGA
jgi:hypothetical protein